MTPTWATADGSVQLYLADCLSVLPQLEAGSVDAVVTDPPYGINWQPRVNHQDQPWVDDRAFDPSPFLRIGRFHVLWGANFYSARLPQSEAWLTWVKRPIDFDFSNDGRSYSTTELAWSDFGKSRFMCHTWDGGMRAGDPCNRTFCHPSQKPLELMQWCLPDGARTILDPFNGSGTTTKMARECGRRYIGIEINADYCEIARKRLSQQLLPLCG